jgi:hypothetical protein
MERIRIFGRCRLLDLGAATSENVAFLSSLPANLTIADVPSILASADPGPRSPAAFGTFLARGMPPVAPSSVDVILGWDLLNYLPPPEIEALGSLLAACCRPHTLLFALISTLPEIPDQPQRFRIVGPDSLAYETATRYRRHGPQYNEPDLCRWLHSFEVDTSFLLRNGMKEYLFAVRPTAPPSPQAPGSRR